MSNSRTRAKSAAESQDGTTASEREVTLPRTDGGADQAADGASHVGASTSGDEETQERIRARAYELYCERGPSEGGALADWLEAERDVRTRS